MMGLTLALISVQTHTQPTVRNAIYSRVTPEPVKNPQVVAVSAQAMAVCLDLSLEELQKREQDVAEYFGGACLRVVACVADGGMGVRPTQATNKAHNSQQSIHDPPIDTM